MSFTTCSKTAITVFVFMVLTIAVLTTNCRRVDRKRKKQLVVETVQNLSYIKDSRTGLCFAVYSAYQQYGLARIPCSHLKQNKKPEKDPFE